MILLSRNPPILSHPVTLSAFSEALCRTWNPRPRCYQGQGPIRIGLAISGGVDSMALASLCSKWLKGPIELDPPSPGLLRFHELRSRICLQGFIVDHGVRDGSDKEARSVAEMLQVQGIPARVLSIKWPGGINPAGQSNFESLARKYRFQELGLACRAMGIDSLFLAHHRDDQAETALMRLIDGHRGVGLSGMGSSSAIPECYGIHGVHESGGLDLDSGGIEARPENQLAFETGGIKIYRPLLSFPKSQLKTTCEAFKVPWFEDHTNSDPTLTRRNAVRHFYAHHKVPLALSKNSILALSCSIRETSKARHKKADEWFRSCHVHRFNNKAGTLSIRIPPPEIMIHDKFDRHETQKIAALLLRRIISLISPEEHVHISALKGSVERIFPYLFGPSKISKEKIFTVAGVKFTSSPLRSPNTQGQGFKEEDWFISRQPHPSKLSSRPSIWIPRSTTLEEEEWNLPWTLYDGRFWIRVKSPTDRLLHLRPLAPADISYIRSYLNKCERPAFEKLLRAEAPGSVRWTIPALTEVVNDQVKVLGLPTLDFMIDRTVGINCEVRYKQVCM